MDGLEKTAEFISSCIEAYKIRHSMRGTEVANLFDRYGVLDYLADGYDMLHTQSLQYVVGEIELFLAHRGVEQ